MGSPSPLRHPNATYVRPDTPVLWLWVQRAILENKRVEDLPADDAAPPHEGPPTALGLQIHERLFHHQIVTAWASLDEAGSCLTPTTHAPLLEASARSLPDTTDAARGPGEVLASCRDDIS